jgi:FixJ family two-component response regulator
LRQLNVAFPIIFMSGNAEKEDVIEAWRGGAVDFILKPFSGPQISAVVSALFEKMEEASISMRVKSTTLDHVDLPITPREADVLMLLGEGYRQGEVADILGIGLRTVKMYRGYLKDKLGLNTLVQLSRFYDQNQGEIQKRASGVSGRERPLAPKS